MAKPRIFISSTFYDLRQIREDLERSIKELGYEPVRNETGAIPYGKNEAPESAAYREVELCDVIVAIVGGRYGTESREIPGYSISQNELRRALELGIQVFMFVERSVWAEFATYELNKTLDTVRYRFVDNTKVFEFLDELQRLPRNNPIAQFETAWDISKYLRDQFAGFMHRFLTDQTRRAELRVLDEIRDVAKTLKEVVTYLTEERKNKDEAIRSILVVNHPAFRRFAEVTKTHYRIFFSTKHELDQWLRARSWHPVDPVLQGSESVAEWEHSVDDPNSLGTIKLRHNIFAADGRLIPFSESEWNDEWVERIAQQQQQKQAEIDDVPF
jgi:hypothetical protein